MRQILGNNLYMQHYIFRYIPHYAFVKILTVITTALWEFFLFTYSFKYVMDSITKKKSFFDILPVFILAGGITIVIIYLKRWMEHYYMPVCREKLAQKMQIQLMKKASTVDLACYDMSDFYNDMIMAHKNADTKALDIFNAHVDILGQIISITVFFALLISLDMLGLAFALTGFIFGIIINSIYNKLNLKCETELAPLYRKRDYTGRIFFLAEYAKEIRLSKIRFPLMEGFKQSIQEVVKKNKEYEKKFIALRLLNFFSTTFLTNILYMIVLIYKIAVLKTLSIGDFTALYLAMDKLSYWLLTLMETITDYQKNSLHTNLFRKFENYENTVKDDGSGILANEPIDIRVDNLSFQYPRTDKLVLKNIAMHIRKNEKIAIAGYNGSGKSTLVKLLLRLYDPDTGVIKMDKTDIKKYSLESYRKHMGVVFQDFQTYACTVEENVAMNIQADNERVWQSLEASGLDARMSELPKKTKSQLGRELYEDGLIMSGGETQKLALARVFYRDFSCVIFDEPSASLDPISEYNFYKSIREKLHDKTVIFISHRLSGTINADKIHMMSDGRIIEQGNHEQLMALNGAYAQAFRLQAEKYTNKP